MPLVTRLTVTASFSPPARVAILYAPSPGPDASHASGLAEVRAVSYFWDGGVGENP